MVYVVCVCGWNACVYSVNWVGVLCNVGLGFYEEWGGRGWGVRGVLEIIIYIVYGKMEMLLCGLAI